MSDNYELVGSIRRKLLDIAERYPRTLDAPRRANLGRSTGTNEAPAPISVHILDARAEVMRDLRYWAGFIYDEIRDHNDGHIHTIIDGDNIDALTQHISRWAHIICDQFPEDANNLHNDVTKHYGALEAIVHPPIKDWVNIGYCPLTVAKDSESVPCGTRLRAYPDKELITCRGCGHEDVRDWWRTKMLGHRPQNVTATQLVDILMTDVQQVADLETIRMWAHRGKIERVYGPRPKGQPWMYDWARVVRDLQMPRQRLQITAV